MGGEVEGQDAYPRRERPWDDAAPGLLPRHPRASSGAVDRDFTGAAE